MVKALALWSHPTSEAEFEEEYFSSHIPFARAAAVPGMRELKTTRVLNEVIPSDYYRVAELIFDDAESLQKGLSSPEMARVVADGKSLADKHGSAITMILVESD